MTDQITILPATPADLAEINAIYNYYIALMHRPSMRK